MKHYRYDVLTADIDCHIQKHPQEQMVLLGAKVLKSEPVPIADCWWFRVEDEISPLPEYLSELNDSFKFSNERCV